jgi:hypothetical protein
LVACSDDNEKPVPENPHLNYFGTSSNSIWNYNTLSIDPSGAETPVLTPDNLTQLKDSIFLGQNLSYMQYFFLNPLNSNIPTQHNFFMREDSSRLYVTSNLFDIIFPAFITNIIDYNQNIGLMKITDNAVAEP